MAVKKNVNPLDLVKDIVKIASETKAIDMNVINVQGVSSLADYIVIASARSQIQVQGIAHNITEKLAKEGYKSFSMEGFFVGEWILIDYNDVIVHILLDDARMHYDIDSLFKNYNQIKVDEKTGDLILW